MSVLCKNDMDNIKSLHRLVMLLALGREPVQKIFNLLRKCFTERASVTLSFLSFEILGTEKYCR